MKKIIFVLGLVLSVNTFASSLFMMQTVVSSEAAKDVTTTVENQEGYMTLDRVELTRTYRCPNCFEYTMTFSRPNPDGGRDEKKVALITREGSGGKIQVGIKE